MNKLERDDPIQAIIEDCAGKLFSSSPVSKLGITHFLCGDKTTPGAIRKSALRTRNSYLNDFCKSLSPARANDQHRKVLREHISCLDRNNTFLSIVESIFSNNQGIEFLQFVITPSKALAAYEIKPLLETHEDDLQLIFQYGPRFADALAPKALVLQYFQALYQGKGIAEYLWEEKFLHCRAEVFGRTADKRQSDALQRFRRLIQNEEEEQHLWWHLICALQSALVYFVAATARNSTKLPEGTVIAKRLEKIKVDSNHKPAISPIGIAVLSPLLIDRKSTITKLQLQKDREKAKGLVTRLESAFLIKARDRVIAGHTSGICEKMDPRFHPDSVSLKTKGDFREEIKKLFLLPNQKARAECFSLWMVWLAEWLHKSIHEGHHLDFWLVAGDQTEFADHPNIIFKALGEDDVNPLFVPEEKDNFGEKIKRAASFLEKEHFPWFRRGRYALFWDVGGNMSGPTGLVGIKGSNWEQMVIETYKVKQQLLIPACYLVYTGGVPKEAGVIKCVGDEGRSVSSLHRNKKAVESRSSKTDSATRFTKILRWRNGEWRLVSDDRSRLLIGTLGKLLSVHSGTRKYLDKIAEICLLVADNPQTGGTIVFVEEKGFLQTPGLDGSDRKRRNHSNKKKADNQLFSRMGKPWPMDESAEDKVALISHDGATLISSGLKKWGYRFLLTPDDVDQDVKKSLVADADNLTLDFPLTGVGSRRWSAALAAFKEGVRAVIVISQDGDIQCWSSAKKDTYEQTQFLALPQGGASKSFDFRDKKWKGKEADW